MGTLPARVISLFLLPTFIFVALSIKQMQGESKTALNSFYIFHQTDIV